MITDKSTAAASSNERESSDEYDSSDEGDSTDDDSTDDGVGRPTYIETLAAGSKHTGSWAEFMFPAGFDNVVLYLFSRLSRNNTTN